MPLLESFDSHLGTIRVTRSRNGTVSYHQNGCYHSQADRNGVSVCVYIHVIHEIIRQARARNILIIGGAGGTLATMLLRLGRRVTLVDIDAAAFRVARRYFRLPDAVRCRRGDGIGFLRANHARFDAVVVDVFDAHNNVPRPFTAESFFRLVMRRLAPAGIMAMNIITPHDDDNRARIAARNAEAAGFPITLFDWPGEANRNTILAGNITPRIRIPSGLEPVSLRADFVGMSRNASRRRR